MIKTKILMTMLALVILTTGCVSAGKSETQKETIKLKDTTLIKVESSSADIEIIAEDREDISVVLHTFQRGPRLKVSDGKTIQIEAKQERWVGGISMSRSPKLTIYVPKGYDQSIEVDNSSGDLDINEMALDSLEIHLSSGDVRGKELSFNKGSIDSSSGDIDMENIQGTEFNIHSSSGDLKLEDFTGQLEGDTSSGNVLITFKEFTSDLNYSTQSGDITVDFNEEPIDADFDLQCSSGEVSLNFELDSVEKEKDNRVLGTKGDGSYEVTLHASSGEITVKK